MKYLTEFYLKQELNAIGNIIFTEKGIELAEHALNFGPEHNAKKHMKLLDLFKMHEKAAVMREHLKSHDDIKVKNGIATELMEFALRDYDNRTIEIENEGRGSYEMLVDKLSRHEGMDFVVNYKYWSFEPLDISKWDIHKPRCGERLLFYALDYDNLRKNKIKEAEENQKKAMREAAHELGRFVHDKPKKYMKWAHRTYKINAKEGMHARPSSELIKIANKYDGEVWLRTESNEIIGKSIMYLLMLGITSDKEFTILYKPKEEAEPFFSDLEGIVFEEDRNLFTRLR